MHWFFERALKPGILWTIVILVVIFVAVVAILVAMAGCGRGQSVHSGRARGSIVVKKDIRSARMGRLVYPPEDMEIEVDACNIDKVYKEGLWRGRPAPRTTSIEDESWQGGRGFGAPSQQVGCGQVEDGNQGRRVFAVPQVEKTNVAAATKQDSGAFKT